MTICSLCNQPLTADTIQAHNRSGCLALRSPLAPFPIIKRLDSRIIKRWRPADHQQNELRDGGLTDRR